MNKEGQSETVDYQHEKDSADQKMCQKGHKWPEPAREPVEQDVNIVEFFSFQCDASPHQGCPNETETGKFLRPTVTEMKDVAGKHLEKDAKGHDQKESTR